MIFTVIIIYAVAQVNVVSEQIQIKSNQIKSTYCLIIQDHLKEIRYL